MKKKKKRKKINDLIAKNQSNIIIPLSFMFVIAVGTILLSLPVSTQSGEGAPFVTAIFTATTSVCVTGTTVVDTFSYWSLFGKVVILLLIQVGGLGIISFILLFYIMKGKSVTLREGLLLRDVYNVDDLTGIEALMMRVFAMTFIIEFVGMLAYLPALIPRFGVIRGIWYSLFNSISAFCNAGIDIMGPDSLMSYSDNYYVMSVTMILIITGGIGYIVLLNLYFKLGLKSRIQRKNPTHVRLGEHTKLVLWGTAIIILGGALYFLTSEWDNPGTIGLMSFPDKVMNCLFQSVTLRTAGFSTISQQSLHNSSALMGVILMFIGGSPMGTAGGIKTVTFFILLANIYAFVLNKEETVVFGRRVTNEAVRKATAIAMVQLFFTLVFSLWLMRLNQSATFIDVLYEVTSATSTVGVSRGFVLTLPDMERLILVLAMFLGRIGPISMLFFFNANKGDNSNGIKTAEGRFIVG